MMLGRQPHDPAVIARAPKLSTVLGSLTAPDSLPREDIKFTPGMYDNDQIGDCVEVAIANCANAAAALDGYSLPIVTDDVVGLYKQGAGYDGTPATDQGSIITTVLASQASAGFKIAAEQTPLIGAWGTFDPADQGLMRICAANVGTALLGVALSMADQASVGAVWDTVNSTGQDPTPGSWGGHGTFLFGWEGIGDDDMVALGTWGGFQMATWRWMKVAVEEAHGIMWRQLWAQANPGLYDKLMADTQLFTV